MPFLGLVLGGDGVDLDGPSGAPARVLLVPRRLSHVLPDLGRDPRAGTSDPGVAPGPGAVRDPIWPWTFRRSGSAGFVAAPGLRVTDGIAGFVQWSGSADPGRMADLVMVCGGSIANIAWAALLVLLSGQLGATSPPALIPFLQCCALGSCLMGAWNLVPVWNDALAWSDGAQMLRLLGRGHRAFRIRGRPDRSGPPATTSPLERLQPGADGRRDAARGGSRVAPAACAQRGTGPRRSSGVRSRARASREREGLAIRRAAGVRAPARADSRTPGPRCRRGTNGAHPVAGGSARIRQSRPRGDASRRGTASAGRPCPRGVETDCGQAARLEHRNQWAIDRLEHDLTVAPPEQGEGS
jgi:hypothetical protein